MGTGDQFIGFSTNASSTNLYAVTADSSQAWSSYATDLGPIPSGVHYFRIVMDTDNVNFYIDDQLVAIRGNGLNDVRTLRWGAGYLLSDWNYPGLLIDWMHWTK